MKRTLWIAREAGRYFLVPDTVRIEPGATRIERLPDGDPVHADLEALAIYERTRTEATAWLRERSEADDSEEETTIGEGLALLARLVGEDARRLVNDPEALRAALGQLGNGARDLFGAATSDDPQQVEAASARADAIRDAFVEAGIPIGDLGALVHRIHAFTHAPERTEERHRLAERLRGIARRARDLARETQDAADRVDIPTANDPHNQ